MTSTAPSSRVLQAVERQDKAMNYRMLLPILPTGNVARDSVFLHADPSARPYGLPDFATALEGKVDRSDIKSTGAYLFSHVWILTFHTAIAKKQFLENHELTVKGRRCVIIDPNKKEISLKLHWLPAHVANDSVIRALEQYGTVRGITREKWRYPGFEDVETTTRIIELTMKSGVTSDQIPHQLQIAGSPVLVAIPGRPPLCLRCKRTGHMRKECSTPWCRTCRTYGHEGNDCVRSYAAATPQDKPPEETMFDAAEDGKAEAAEPVTAVTVVENNDQNGDAVEPPPPNQAEGVAQKGDSAEPTHPDQADEAPTDTDMAWEVVTAKRKVKGSNPSDVQRAQEESRKEQRREAQFNKRVKHIQESSLIPVRTDWSSLEDPSFLADG